MLITHARYFHGGGVERFPRPVSRESHYRTGLYVVLRYFYFQELSPMMEMTLFLVVECRIVSCFDGGRRRPSTRDHKFLFPNCGESPALIFPNSPVSLALSHGCRQGKSALDLHHLFPYRQFSRFCFRGKESPYVGRALSNELENQTS